MTLVSPEIETCILNDFKHIHILFIVYQVRIKGQTVKHTNSVSRSVASPSVSAADLRQSGMETLEHVAVTVTVIHPCRGNVEFVLICPSGMTSVIGARRAIDR